MLTGINPFQKANIVSTLEAVQRYDPPPPSQYERRHAPFDAIVARALAKDRDRRYADAAEMLDDLRRIVVPRSPERLGQLMARLFRQQLDAEQQLLGDPDAAARSTPARPSPTPIAKVQQPEGGTQILNPPAPPPKKVEEPPEGGTLILDAPPVAAKKVATPPRGVPAARPTPPPKLTGAGDTLLDAGGPAIARTDDLAGGTVMLRPSAPLPPPRRVSSSTETLPDASAAVALSGGDGRTMLLGTAPARPQRKQGAAEDGATRMLTPEESQAAAREAMAKLQKAQQQVVRTTSRPTSGSRMWSGRGVWVALGIGAVAAVVGIAVLLFWLLSDEPVAPRPRRATAAVAPQVQKEEAPAPAPVQTKTAPQPILARHGEPEPPPRRVVGAGKLYGTLSVNPHGGAQVVFGGTAQPRQIGAYNLPVTGDSGTVEVGDSSTPFRVQLDYLRSGTALNLKISSSPLANVWVDGASLGKGPVSGVKLDSRSTAIELKKPGEDRGMLVKLQYRAN
jgi:hypothetical protein